MSAKPMSLEAIADEERREVLALLGQRNRRPSVASQTAHSRAPSAPSAPSASIPRTPSRSMLDLGPDSPPPPPFSSHPPPQPGSERPETKQAPARPAPTLPSMLDIDTPITPDMRNMFSDVPPRQPPSPARRVASTPATPTHPHSNIPPATHVGATVHHRSLSDRLTSASQPSNTNLRLPSSTTWSTTTTTAPRDLTSEYKFSISSSLRLRPPPPPQSKPPRRGKHWSVISIVDRIKSPDVTALTFRPSDRSRHKSQPIVSAPPAPSSSNKPLALPAQLGTAVRADSPARMLGRHFSPARMSPARTDSPAPRGSPPAPLRVELQDGQTVDISHAYKHLSDASLARSHGSLAELGQRRRSEGNAQVGRLEKDYMSPDGDILDESNSSDSADSSSSESERGRKTKRRFDDDLANNKARAASEASLQRVTSLLGAAEEERIQVAARSSPYQDSDFQADFTPRPEKKSRGIRPATSYIAPTSHDLHSHDSNSEAEVQEIKRAQKLAVSMTPITTPSDAQRTIRVIDRGDYARVVQEDVDSEHRSPRKYLVAMDLSEESTHALEWAVGTVLRDGDILLAVYCVDEEGSGLSGGDSASVLLCDDSNFNYNHSSNNDTSSIHTTVNTYLSSGIEWATTRDPAGYSPFANPSPLTRTPLTTPASPPQFPDPFLLRPIGATDGSVAPSIAPSGRERSKAEEVRFRAVQDITDRVMKLLRKTRLQVRVIIEALHCKNPRHVITEIIDLLNPTLVILGSRGRSALKGVILGSFSNYLVTKSSVPVMVVRKRLRKRSKFKRSPVTQVNNLSSPMARSLSNAKVD